MIRLLIVHQDVALAQQLAQLVKEFTGCESGVTRSESETLVLLRRRPQEYPRILLTQLEAPGLDGFNLAGTLSEAFPGLQTLFFPPYPASEQRIEVATSKVFPEPIDGDRLLATIERSVRMRWNAPDWFHPLDILQMCCLARRHGAVQMVRGSRIGTVYLRNGTMVHAETAGLHGQNAIVEILSWEEVEFAYERSVTAATETLADDWDKLLAQAVEERKRRALPEWRQTA